LDARYLGYFECFNQQLFFEAHEVLEELWLGERGGARDLFYKGLIQLAGAFVHLQKERPQPAASLLRLARSNLARFPTRQDQLDVTGLVELIDSWLKSLESTDASARRWSLENPPKLRLATA